MCFEVGVSVRWRVVFEGVGGFVFTAGSRIIVTFFGLLFRRGLSLVVGF